MAHFGVVSPALKAAAQKVVLPQVQINNKSVTDQTVDFMGLKLKDLNTLGERSATGMASATGILVLQVMPNSALKTIFKLNDVILMFNGKSIARLTDLKAVKLPDGYKGAVEVVVFRDQKEQSFSGTINERTY